MNAGWKVLGFAAITFVVAFVAARLLVPDVVPIGFQEEAQPSWEVLTAFALRAIELLAAWLAAIAFAVMCGEWARRRFRRVMRLFSPRPRRPAG
jgi:hypothetical protein